MREEYIATIERKIKSCKRQGKTLLKVYQMYDSEISYFQKLGYKVTRMTQLSHWGKESVNIEWEDA